MLFVLLWFYALRGYFTAPVFHVNSDQGEDDFSPFQYYLFSEDILRTEHNNNGGLQ